MNEPTRSLIYTAAQVQDAVKKVAAEVLIWLHLESHERLELLSVLEGARPFTRDLMRELTNTLPSLKVRIHEVRVKGTAGTHLMEKRQQDWSGVDWEGLKGAPVLIVDDLVDSGKTLRMLKAELTGKGVEARTAVLIRKYGKDSFPLDFCGFELALSHEELKEKGLKDRWLYGYGMDLDGTQRELDHIGWLEIPA